MLTMLAPGDGRFSEPCALLMGGFDGIHLGHATLLERARSLGLPAVLTTIAGGKAGGELFTLAERRTVFARAGAAGAFRSNICVAPRSSCSGSLTSGSSSNKFSFCIPAKASSHCSEEAEESS